MDRDSKIKAAYHTLGCKLNFSETSAIGHALRERGVRNAEADEHPDIIVVNTCSVTEMADKKGRNLIRSLHRRHPDAAIVVTGCYAQLKPGEVSSIPGVEIVLGAGEKLRAAEFVTRWLDERRRVCRTTPSRDIREFVPTCESGDRTRWFLKVQDGCDYFCTYCTIPYARGRSRSGNIPDLVRMAEEAAGHGAREIVITGVNIGDFGRDNGQSFFDLIRALDKVEGIDRYRISSIEPNLLTDEIIDWCAESRAFMPHFHIPLQSGSDHVLKMMNRRYGTELFAERIEHIRRVMPQAFIGVDVIAGARGETHEEWLRARDFIESLPVTRLHVFPYSERPGTAALKLPDPVEPQLRHERVAELIDFSDRKLAAFLDRQIGSRASVLWESTLHDDGTIQGFTENYVRIQAPWDDSLPNTITPVTVSAENIVPNQG
ncbi:MAG: tRNA (N(6)-L-threonylcarbamoyladenosine(37)-C(2))-methylthiotransferase MtaB [Bacteroidales bacterium]|nr:tRNA (N(6)-L-threonylcarbamoyladenosine(37)-C(2))-methylthiotransferase MtaB [Bacteroidales bacterium]